MSLEERAQASSVYCVSKFCYLGDMLGAVGGGGDALVTRVKYAWVQFKEEPIVNRRG